MRQYSSLTAVAALTAALSLAASTRAAQALLIDPTFDPGVSAQAQTAFNYAAAEYEHLFSDPITINIEVQAGNSGLGGSETFLAGFLSYGQVRSALIADNAAHPSAAGNISVGAGGSVATLVDPTNGGNFLVSTAEGKALGLLGPSSAIDGIFTYNANFTYTYNPSDRAVPGEFDFIGVAEHEISEIMGRIPGLGASFCGGCGSDYLPYDLFRYTGAGARGIADDGGGVYFSIDNGVTDLHGYNDAAVNGGDPQDWDSSIPADAYDAFTGTNQGHYISPEDITTLDVIGYDLSASSAVPEPATWALLGLGFVGLGLVRRPRRAGLRTASL